MEGGGGSHPGTKIDYKKIDQLLFSWTGPVWQRSSLPRDVTISSNLERELAILEFQSRGSWPGIGALLV